MNCGFPFGFTLKKDTLLVQIREQSLCFQTGHVQVDNQAISSHGFS